MAINTSILCNYSTMFPYILIKDEQKIQHFFDFTTSNSIIKCTAEKDEE